jgi:hypothetical protein
MSFFFFVSGDREELIRLDSNRFNEVVGKIEDLHRQGELSNESLTQESSSVQSLDLFLYKGMKTNVHCRLEQAAPQIKIWL